MKEISPEIFEHRIPLEPDVVLVRQQRYKMNPKYAEKVRETLDDLLVAGFVYLIESSKWMSSIVVVPKKNGKLRVCVDYMKLNQKSMTDPYPVPYIDLMLDNVARHEMYSFLDGFSGYHQVSMAPEDKEKIAFITDWGAFAYRVMSFGLKNTSATFQRFFMEAFSDYITNFMKLYLEDFTIYGAKRKHLKHLRKCFLRCMQHGISLNPTKYSFAVVSGVLLGHIVCK